MILEEHVQTAREFMERSDRYFVEGDVLQGSEKAWGAATHAVMALAQQRGWDFGSHRAMIRAVNRIGEELGDRALRAEFGVAEQFHANYYHGFMEDFQIENNRPTVREFVGRMLALVDDGQAHSNGNLAE